MIVCRKENNGLKIGADAGCLCGRNFVIALSGDIVKFDDLGKTIFDARSIANHFKGYYVNNSGGFLANAITQETAKIFNCHRNRNWDVTYVIFEFKNGRPWYTKIHVYNEWGMTCRIVKGDVCGDLMVFDGKIEDFSEELLDIFMDVKGVINYVNSNT